MRYLMERVSVCRELLEVEADGPEQAQVRADMHDPAGGDSEHVAAQLKLHGGYCRAVEADYTPDRDRTNAELADRIRQLLDQKEQPYATDPWVTHTDAALKLARELGLFSQFPDHAGNPIGCALRSSGQWWQVVGADDSVISDDQSAARAVCIAILECDHRQRERQLMQALMRRCRDEQSGIQAPRRRRKAKAD